MKSLLFVQNERISADNLFIDFCLYLFNNVLCKTTIEVAA